MLEELVDGFILLFIRTKLVRKYFLILCACRVKCNAFNTCISARISRLHLVLTDASAIRTTPEKHNKKSVENKRLISIQDFMISSHLKMESIKKKFRAENENSESIPLLSEIIRRTGGFITPEKLTAILGVSQEIQAKGRIMSEDEKIWLTDFVKQI